MASTVDFKSYCEAELRPALVGLEERRRKVKRIAIGGGATMAGFATLLLVLPSGVAPVLIPVLFVTAVVTGILWWYKWQAFRTDYKEAVLPRVVRFLDPGLQYRADGMIDRGKFVAGRIFNQRIDRYQGEDRVSGTMGATRFEFSELHVEYKTTSSSKGRTTSTWHTIFKGLYFVADFNKHFQSYTVVLPDQLESTLGFLGKALQSMNPSRDDLIRLEDPEFENEFVVYGRDQVEARYILSPALMERMLVLKRKVGVPVYFAFIGSEVHVAISTGKEHFEPRLFASLLEDDHLSAYLDDLRLVTGIVEDLNLNTRIWSKA